jgi:hypothetical protein
MARLLSYHAAERLGRFLGMQEYWLTGSRRRVALENLTYAFPEKSPQEIRGGPSLPESQFADRLLFNHRHDIPSGERPPVRKDPAGPPAHRFFGMLRMER